MPEHVGEDELEAFRREHLTGRRTLDRLAEAGGKMMDRLAVGVGKSRCLDDTTVEALRGGDYDLVLVLAPTRRPLRERRPLLHPPPGVRVVELRPRPADRCGPERDARWRKFERSDLGALGRAEICGACPLRRRCFWPDQYGRGLEGARIVYATQAQMERDPGFIRRVAEAAGSLRPVTFLDEADISGKSFDRSIGREALGRFVDVLTAATPRCIDPEWGHGRWREQAEMLLGASTSDLQDVGWRMPAVRRDWAAAVQRIGVERHGDDFRFLGFALAEFARSPVETRRRTGGGAVEYATRPIVGDVVLFTATASRDYASYRLGADLASPFGEHSFRHRDTRWSNLASQIGTRGFFPRHAPQILDLVAALTARRAGEGSESCSSPRRNSSRPAPPAWPSDSAGWAPTSGSSPRAGRREAWPTPASWR